MKKVWKLRRAGVLVLAVGLGVLLGQLGTNIVVAGFIVVSIMWLLVYDFATEERFLREERGWSDGTETKCKNG